MPTTQVLVVGGGYAGVMAANRLTGGDDLAVTLVNARPQFVERIRLHQLVGGSDDGVEAYDDVLAPAVRLVVDEATRIDASRRRLLLGSGGSLAYDYLVYAVGSGPGAPSIAGAAEHAYPIATLEAAQRLRRALDAAPDASVTVVGAGPTGIETAAELAETGRRVTLVCGAVLGPYLHPRGRRATRRQLEALGVTVLEGVSVVGVHADAVELSDGRRVPGGITVWTTGFAVPDLARRSGLTTDGAGRLLTDETLTSVDDDRIVGTGDAVAPSGLPQRMSCQAAMPLGAQAAQTVLSRVTGTAPSPITNGFLAQCVSLGRRAGMFQAAHRDDTAMWLSVGGRPGAMIKELVCAQILAALGREARRPGSLRWPVDRSRSRRVEASRAEQAGVVA